MPVEMGGFLLTRDAGLAAGGEFSEGFAYSDGGEAVFVFFDVFFDEGAVMFLHAAEEPGDGFGDEYIFFSF